MTTYSANEIIAACNAYDAALVSVHGDYSKNRMVLDELHNTATNMVDWIFSNLTPDNDRVFVLPSGEKIRHVDGAYFDRFELCE